MDSHRRLRFVVLVAAFLAGSLLGCDSGSVTGPTSVPGTPPPVVQLQAPTLLRGRWAEAAGAPYVPPTDNVVVLIPHYAKDDPEETARLLASRSLPVIVFAGHIYHNAPSTWAAAWPNFDRYLEPFRRRGLLVGIQPLDEPAHHGQWSHVAPAIADVRARGLKVLLTEVVTYMDESGHFGGTKFPAGVDWAAVTCYSYPGTRWTVEACAEEYREHPGWNTVVGQGFDAGSGLPSRSAWERIAQGPPERGILWWERP